MAISTIASLNGMALIAALRTALPTHFNRTNGLAMCCTWGAKETERRRRAAPAGPAKSHDGTAPGRPFRGVAGTASVVTPRTLRTVFGRFARSKTMHAWNRVVSGLALARSLLWSVLRGPGMKARHRHVADAHHLTLLDRGPCAKQESCLPARGTVLVPLHPRQQLGASGQATSRGRGAVHGRSGGG